MIEKHETVVVSEVVHLFPGKVEQAAEKPLREIIKHACDQQIMAALLNRIYPDRAIDIDKLY